MPNIETRFVINDYSGEIIEIFQKEDEYIVYKKYLNSGDWSQVFVNNCGDLILKK